MTAEYSPSLADQVEAVNSAVTKASSTQSLQIWMPVGGATKRRFDILCAFLALITLFPLLILVAIAIKSSGSGPIFFRHQRIGANGAVFNCLKFRTMRENSENILSSHFRDDPNAYIEWQATRKLKRDPRVTAIGEFLRKSSLDELPQILNIIAGEMSIVGPRPVVADEIGMYGADARHYLSARPGLTGAWQVSGRNDVSYAERVRFDRSYVENWSMTTDLLIILRTLPAVFFRRGSY